MTFPIIPSDSIQKFIFMSGVLLLIVTSYMVYESNHLHSSEILRINHDAISVRQDSIKSEYYKAIIDDIHKSDLSGYAKGYKIDSINAYRLNAVDWRYKQLLLDLEIKDNTQAYVGNMATAAIIFIMAILFLWIGFKNWMKLQETQDSIQTNQLEILKLDLAAKQKVENIKVVRYIKGKR